MHCARALNVIIVLIAWRFSTKAGENNVAEMKGSDCEGIKPVKKHSEGFQDEANFGSEMLKVFSLHFETYLFY